MKHNKRKKYNKLTVTPRRAMQLMCMKMIYYAYHDIKHQLKGSPSYIDAMEFLNSEWGNCILMFAREDSSTKDTYSVLADNNGEFSWH